MSFETRSQLAALAIRRVLGWRLGRLIITSRLVERLIARLVRVWRATDERWAFDAAVRLVEAVIAGEAATRVAEWRVHVEGWCVDVVTATTARSVAIHIGGSRVGRSRPRRRRPDVAAHFGDPRLLRSGYSVEAIVPADRLEPLSVIGSFPDGESRALDFTDGVIDYLLDVGVTIDDRPPVSGDGPPAGFVDGVSVTSRFRRMRGVTVTGLAQSAVFSGDWLTFEAAKAADDRRVAHQICDLVERTGLDASLEIAEARFAIRDDARASEVLEAWASRQPVDVVVGTLQVVPLTNYEFTRVLEPTVVEVSSPSVWAARSPGVGSRQLDVPELGVGHLRSAHVVRGSTVVVDGELVLYDEAARPSLGFIAGTWDHIAGSSTRPDAGFMFARYSEERSLDRAILLSGRADHNHFHFLIEYLPRMGLVERMPDLDDVPVLVTEDIGPACREALEIVAGSREILSISKDDLVSVRDLFVPSMHTYHPDSTRLPWIEGCRYSPELLSWLRQKLLMHMSDTEWPPLVFLERHSSARSLLNQDAVFEAVASLGFVRVDPASLSMADQMSLFNRAEVIVGAGGSAFSNLLFASASGRTVAMVSEQIQDYVMLATLAAFVGHSFTYVTGRSKQRPTDFSWRRDYLSASFVMSPKQVRRAVKEALAEASPRGPIFYDDYP